MIQDKQGFLWIGTADGLNRFDGINFILYRKQWNDRASLPSNVVNALVEDSDRRIWIATDEGLCWLDVETDIIHRKEISDSISQRILSLALDSNKYLWVGTKEYVHRIDLKNLTNRPFKISSEPAYRWQGRAGCMYLDPTGFLYTGGWDGVYKINTSTGQSRHILKMNLTIRTIKFFDDSTLWLGSWGLGIIKFKPGEHPVAERLPLQNENPKQLLIVNDLVRWISPEGKIYYWAATNYGIAIKASDTDQFSRVYDFETGLELFKLTLCRKILVDRDHNFWVASEQGFCKLDFRKQQFFTYDLDKFNISGQIHSVIRDPQLRDHYYVALWPGGLVSYDAASQQVVHRWVQSFKPWQDSLTYIFSIILDQAKRLWVGTDKGGICLFDPQRGYIYYPDPENSSKDHSNVVFKIREDSDHHLWLATKAGLAMFDPSDHSYHYYFHYDTSQVSVLGDYRFTSLTIDRNNNVWCLSPTEGVIFFNQKDHSFSRIKTYDPENKLIQNLSANAIEEGTDGKMWLATTEGLFCFDKDQKRFRAFVNKDIPAFINAFYTESKNKIWLVGDSRLYLLNPEKNEVTLISVLGDLGTSDAFSVKNISSNTLCITGQGKFVLFQPLQLKLDSNVDPVRLVDFRLLDKDSTIYISDNKRLLPFSYNQNDIRFDFQLLNYDDPLNIKYAFMLDGLDNHWNFIGKSHSASYTHIPKGNYTLLVKAANSDGVWTQPFQLAHFSISPPFWQTWWFYTLCILSLAAILYGLYRIRINKILAVQRIRNLISRDLHDDVGSTLTGIIMMSEIGENSAQAKTGEAESWLRRIGNNSREMMDNMRDIVWSVNPSKDVMAEVVARMKQYAAQLLEPIDTAYSFDIDQRVFTLHLDFIYKRNVYLIFKEALANASKYANCTEVRIQLSVKENNLKMMVRDNGKGFNVSEVALGNGLRNMHQRALQIKGKLVIESSAEKGTGVALTVPLTRIRYFLPKRFR